jgi:tetratricopeptide (TPR) repeat protein
MKPLLMAIIILLTLSSCTNPNIRAAANDVKGCIQLKRQGEWYKASEACKSAAINAELGGGSPHAIADMWYEYGRTSGVICNYVESKKGLEKSLEIDQANNGPIIMDYFELAQLHFAQKKYQESANYYQLGVSFTEIQVIANDPIGYADVLDEYGEALKQIGDALNSNRMFAESKKLRSDNPNSKRLTKRTPYGKFCDQKS